MQSKAYISGLQIHLRSQNPQCSLLKQMHHNSFFITCSDTTMKFSDCHMVAQWVSVRATRHETKILSEGKRTEACPNATVCLRNSVCSEHSDTIHIVLLSKDTVLRIIRLKNIKSFWELSGFKVLHTESGLAEGKVMHLSLKLKSSSSLSTRPAISCCSLCSYAIFTHAQTPWITLTITHHRCWCS